MNQKIKISLLACSLISALSCSNQTNENHVLSIESGFKARAHEIRGTLSHGDSVVGELRFHDCYCTKSEGGLQIDCVHLMGIENDHLFLSIYSDSVKAVLQSVGTRVRPDDFVFKHRKMVLNSQDLQIGQSLQASIELAGSGIDYNGEVAKVILKGDFECIVKDDTYGYDDFRKDLVKKYEQKKE